jgi:hypothetical protein
MRRAQTVEPMVEVALCKVGTRHVLDFSEAGSRANLIISFGAKKLSKGVPLARSPLLCHLQFQSHFRISKFQRHQVLLYANAYHEVGAENRPEARQVSSSRGVDCREMRSGPKEQSTWTVSRDCPNWNAWDSTFSVRSTGARATSHLRLPDYLGAAPVQARPFATLL